ncbi:MAG: hypothetical protein ACYDHW_06335 [Syntrophorhabdaceae bacterium]
MKIRFKSVVKIVLILISFSITPSAFAEGGWEIVGNENFTPDVAGSLSIYVDNGIPYVAYADTDRIYEPTVKMFDGTNWLTVGDEKFSDTETNSISFVIGDGIPYVAYSEGWEGPATVKKFDGTNWILVGSAGFTEGKALERSLAFHDGSPYLAYKDYPLGNKLTVKKYDGMNWTTVGTPGFTTGWASSVDLFIYDGIPYVIYADGALNERVCVKKFDGTDWISVGDEGFSVGRATYTKIFVYNGIPYVAYLDHGIDPLGSDSSTIIKKFDGTNWITLCSEDISDPQRIINHISLWVDNGMVYMAGTAWTGEYSEGLVKKWDGNSLTILGTGSFSKYAGEISLFIYEGVAYVAYNNYANMGKATVVKHTLSNNQAPTAVCKDATVSAGPNCTASASIDNNSYDLDNDSITLGQNPAGPYSMGDSSVTLTVTDSKGASNQCTGIVTVVDNSSPTISNLSVSNPTSWPVNQMVDVTINYQVMDNCAEPSLQVKVTSLQRMKSSDYAVVDPHHIKLKAVKGRVYTITIIATDSSDNSSSQTVTVAVPKKK